MGKEGELHALIAFGTSPTVSRKEGLDVEVVDPEYELLVREVREAYVGLLNTYGTSSGRAVEERQHFPTSKFLSFRISSSSTCPDVAITLREGEIMHISLKSLEHVDRIFDQAKLYDPNTLSAIFPEDQVELAMVVSTRTPPHQPRRIVYKNKDFFIRPTEVASSSFTTDSRKKIDFSKWQPAKSYQATKQELEMLLRIAPFLETQYQILRPSLPPPASEQSKQHNLPFLRRLLPGR